MKDNNIKEKRPTNYKKHNRRDLQNKINDKQDIISCSNYIFEQVKLQQETRDKWMGFYFSIFGAVAAFATFALSFLDDKLSVEQLELIIGITFILTGILGIFFYLLFLCQRVNYKMHYKVLNEIQKKIIEQYLTKSYENYYPLNRMPFKKFKKGADFYASIIQNVVIVVCNIIGIIFVLISHKFESTKIIYICLIACVFIVVLLRWLYNSFEKVM